MSIDDQRTTDLSKNMTPDERVGILLVHGIGEQCRFEHLVEVARNIALALKADNQGGPLQVQITVRTNRDSAYAAQQETWSAHHSAPVIVAVENQVGYITELHFHEVWWADLAEPTTLGTTLGFWGWGLSLWANPGYLVNTVLDLYEDKMIYPGSYEGSASQRKVPKIARVVLFGVSLIVLLIMPVLAVVNRVLSLATGITVRLDLIAQYLSRVRLFQQSKRSSKSPLVYLDQPPRAAIRRRMVLALIDIACQNYNRWYILAHSQGTVLALNGLMEIEQALPNYLSQELWLEIKQELGKKAESAQDLASGAMRPQRPFWLKNDDLIDRKKLFSHLRGLMTYGSPLSKFAVLWPASVRLNKDQSALPQDFEWVNIYDPTDPVAGSVKKDFEKLHKNCRDIAYKAAGFHLLSHITYLNFATTKSDRLVNSVASWLLRDGKFIAPAAIETKWVIRLWIFARVAAWWIACAMIAVLVGEILSLLDWLLGFFHRSLPPDIIQWLIAQLYKNGDLSALPQGITTPPYNFHIYIIWAGLIVLLVGVVKRIDNFLSYRNTTLAKFSIKDFFSQKPNQEISRQQIIKQFKEYFSETTIIQALDMLKNERIIRQEKDGENPTYWLPTLNLGFSKRGKYQYDGGSKISREQLDKLCRTFDEKVRYNPIEPSDWHNRYSPPEEFWALLERKVGYSLEIEKIKLNFWTIEVDELKAVYLLTSEDSRPKAIILMILNKRGVI